MKIEKQLLEKIIKLRDLRQAIGEVKANGLKKDDPKALYGRTSQGEPRRPQMERPAPASDDKTEVIKPTGERQVPGQEKPFGLKHLGIKKEFNSVTHQIGIPGSNRHYEVKVDKMAPNIEHTIRLVTSDGSTLSRSPNVHRNIQDAIEDVAHHFNTRQWKK